MTKLSIAAVAFSAGLIASAATGDTAPPKLGSTSVTWEEIQAKPKRRFFENPTATLDELEMHVTHLPPGKAPHAPHSHAEEELVILKEGTLEAMQAGKTRRLGPGAVIFQASNQLHGVKNVGDTEAIYYVARWRSPGMPKPPAKPPAKP